MTFRDQIPKLTSKCSLHLVLMSQSQSASGLSSLVASKASYTYQQVGKWNFFVSTHQQPVALLYQLLFKGKPLGLGLYGGSFRGFVKACYYPLQLMLYQIKRHSGVATRQPQLQFGFNSAICREGHSGYKLFDLQRREITKYGTINVVYFQRDLRNRQLAAKLKLDTPLIAYDQKEGWYKERLIEGATLQTANLQQLINQFDEHCLPLLQQLASAAAPEQPSLAAYRETLAQAISTGLKNFHSSTACKAQIIEIEDFSSAALTKLTTSKSQSVTTIMSHGDFHTGNIMCGPRRQLIDWETLGRRSALYDLFCLFSKEIKALKGYVDLGSQTPFPVDIKPTIMRAVRTLCHLQTAPEAQLQEVVRTGLQLYFLERIAHELDYRQALQQDSGKILSSIVAIIRHFERYELELDQAK